MNLQKHEQIPINLRTILCDSHGKIEFQHAMTALCILHVFLVFVSYGRHNHNDKAYKNQEKLA
ncbi:hypothetical protein [Peribacillus alkalitolerans]|uniref:hypothetical protein n=1 Tax=Peribacillus alkalitolerans TaxID=1550385 RepID=UPI0013D7295F|nr:hypothetical protein [Peribacillus alkalitolerans]